jgi:hypothetical protein
MRHVIFATVVSLLFTTTLWAAPINVTGKGKSEEAALANAKVKAVEQAILQIVDEASYKKYKSKIQATVKGKSYVTSAKEPSDAEFTGAGYEVAAVVDVDMKALEADISGLGILQESMGNPRIMVLYNPKLPQGGKLGATSKDLEAFFDNSYGSIVDVLADKGFDVIDKGTAEKFSLQVAETHEMDIDINKAAAFGLKNHAELILYYQAVGIGVEGDSHSAAKLFIRTELINTTTSRIIASKKVDASSGASTIQEALLRSADEAGKKVAAVTIEAIKKSWKREKTMGSTYIFVMDGVDDAEEISSFRDKMKTIPEMDGIRERESGGGKTTYEVKYSGSNDEVKSFIQKAAKDLGWKLKLIRSEGNRSTWKKQ